MLELIIWPGGTYHYHPLMLTEAVTHTLMVNRTLNYQATGLNYLLGLVCNVGMSYLNGVNESFTGQSNKPNNTSQIGKDVGV